MTIFLLALSIGALIIVSVIAFPFMGLAFLPVFLIAFVALLAWMYTFVRRGPRELPERTTSPNEGELGER